MFSAETETVRHDGKPVLLDLVYVSSLEIRRHIKIKPDAHPLDPKWEPFKWKVFGDVISVESGQIACYPNTLSSGNLNRKFLDFRPRLSYNHMFIKKEPLRPSQPGRLVLHALEPLGLPCR